ncbi:hypothetical protein FKM82_026467, partial [Ascaphus truei]
MFLLQAQRWRSEYEEERPVDLESSGDDDFFDDEDDMYSGSGSGYLELESGLDSGVRFTTETPIPPPTATALKPAPTIHTLPPVRSTWVPPTTQAPVTHWHHPWVPPEAPEMPSIPAAPTPTSPTKPAATTVAVTTATARTTEVRRLQPVVVASTVTVPTPSATEEGVVTWEATDGRLVTSTSQASEGHWPMEDGGTEPMRGTEESERGGPGEVTPTQEPQ